MTRKEALAAGMKVYFTGKPCPKGHVAMRRVSGACCECSRLGRIAYGKANPEKVKLWKANDQKRNRAAANARNRRYAETHREYLRAKNAAYQKANPAKGAATTMRYLTAKRKQCPAWADHAKIQKVYDLCARFRSLGCDFHVDHVIPLQGKNVCGLHVHNNLQIIEAQANRSKSNFFERA